MSDEKEFQRQGDRVAEGTRPQVGEWHSEVSQVAYLYFATR